jgi:ATP-binding cassette subfamily B protein
MKTNTKKTLQHYWRASKKHPISGSVLVVTMFSASIIGVITPLYYKQFFNQLAAGVSDSVIDPLAFQALIGILVIITTLKFGALILRRINNFTLNYFESKVIAELNNFCFAELHKRSFSFFNNNFVGSLTKKVKWFVNAFEAICDRVIWNFFPLIISLTVIIYVLWGINRNLALGIIIWLVTFLIINWIFTRFKMRYDLARTELETKSTAILADTVTNHSNVKLFNGYRREVKSYSDTNEKLRKARRWTWDLGTIFDSIQGFFMVSLEIGIMGYAIYLWGLGQFTIGDFALVQAYLGSLIDKMWDFGNIIRWTYQNLADAEEMTELLETPPEILDIPKAKKLKVSRGEIIFNQVNFNYGDSREILKDFNLTIPAQQRLAIIGPSGAGKSTVIKLLFRIHDVSGGQVLIDGQNIAKATQESLWHNVSLVPQDPILFHRTIKENIQYGQPNATEKEIIDASKAAHCHEFISRLENGYDTHVGERGVKLSGGERQRVAIARAILKNSPILILDEATSSLDSESERLIQDALNKLMKQKTVIVIAHRLSTIRKMDRIITVDNGLITEDGSHEQLLKRKDGTYAKLWQLQAGGFIE